MPLCSINVDFQKVLHTVWSGLQRMFTRSIYIWRRTASIAASVPYKTRELAIDDVIDRDVPIAPRISTGSLDSGASPVPGFLGLILQAGATVFPLQPREPPKDWLISTKAR